MKFVKDNGPLFICAGLFLALVMVGSAIIASGQVKKPVPAAAKPRTINVVTEPNAAVWIDGIQYGKTNAVGNLTITSVAAGAHTLRVRANGFKEISRPLGAAQKGDIEISLVKTTDEAEIAFQKAEALAGRDRELAAAAYRDAIKLRPKYLDAQIGLARVRLDSDDLEGAAEAIADARKARPGYPEASAIEGRIFKEAGEEAKAIAAFKRAITEGKGFQPEAYTGLGLLYKERAEGAGGDLAEETANYDESSRNLRIALKQLSGAPDSVVIYQLLGLILERQNKYNEAIALYEEFLRLFPNTPEATSVQSFIIQLKKQMNNE